MAAEKGSAFLLKVGDGGAPPVYATVAGLRATQLAVNGEAVNVTSKDSGGWLESRGDAALAAGANLAAVGDELLQFGVVEALGARRFRLSRLLRGRRGTEWAAGLHGAGEPFVLLDRATLALAEPPLQALGTEARVQAQGIGDPADAPPAVRTFRGESLRPPSPVHLEAEREEGGAIRLSWVRRSRSGWAWLDGADTALGEEREAYRLTLSAGGTLRQLELDAPAFVYTTEEQAADGLAAPVLAAVAQLGTSAASREAIITLP
jgi:hypothetical protein